MAAKKKRRRVAKKKVAVHIDADIVRSLSKAIELLAGMASVIEQAADDTALRREMKKKKGARSRRKK